jgi:A/G-specific adenine glycosylase
VHYIASMKVTFQEKLLTWDSTSNQRVMPWKGEKDPYKIWLSEIILQQTRVEQGLSYYQKFVTAFPTVFDLAEAPPEKVFKLWEGLGYYSRCKNLIASAKIIATAFDGIFPCTYEDIKALKGIGPYTAAAIASFAFDQPYAVVDGNVQRVIARYFGISTPVDTSTGKNLYQQLATSLLDRKQPGKYNQAIMDFGAIICKPRNPLCGQCPQRGDCEAYRIDAVAELPVKQKKLVKKHRWFYYFLVEAGQHLYIRKRTGSDIWQNLHEFVLFETPEATPYPHDAFLKKLLGDQPFVISTPSRVYVQQLTHQTIHGQFVQVSVPETVSIPSPYLRIPRESLRNYALPRMLNHFLDEELI